MKFFKRNRLFIAGACFVFGGLGWLAKYDYDFHHNPKYIQQQQLAEQQQSELKAKADAQAKLTNIGNLQCSRVHLPESVKAIMHQYDLSNDVLMTAENTKQLDKNKYSADCNWKVGAKANDGKMFIVDNHGIIHIEFQVDEIISQ